MEEVTVADDNLFEGGEAPAAEGGEAQPSPSPLTPEDLNIALNEALARNNQPLVDAVKQVQAKVQAMEVARAREAGAAAEPPSPTDEQKLDEFLADPDAFISKRAEASDRKVMERLAPVLKLQLDQARETLLKDQQALFEREWGSEAWGELATKVTEQLDRLPLEMQASRTHVEAAVAMALGGAMLTPEGREKMESKRAEAARRRAEGASPQMLTGPGRSRPAGVEIHPDERAFVEALNRSGFNYTVKDYAAARTMGNTESEWRAHFEKQRAATRGSK